MAIVYQHRRKDTNEVFYIGIGDTSDRAYWTYGRNTHWKNIAYKVGYEVDILIEGISWDDACVVEIGMIADYGRRDKKTGPLVNMTDGGEGSIGRLVSEHTKEKQRNKMKGKPSSFKGKTHTEESKQKNAEKHLGKSPGNKGKPSPYRGVKRPKHSEDMKGSKNSNAKKVFDVEQNREYGCMKEYMKQNGIANTRLQTLIKKQKLIII
jgi:hypothetical protein